MQRLQVCRLRDDGADQVIGRVALGLHAVRQAMRAHHTSEIAARGDLERDTGGLRVSSVLKNVHAPISNKQNLWNSPFLGN